MVYPASREDILQLLVDQVIMEGHGLPWLQGGYSSAFIQSAKLLLQSSELGLPQPLTRRRVGPPLPPVLGGGARKGLGESQFRRGDIHCGTLYIYVLCGYKHSFKIVLAGFRATFTWDS